MPTYKCVCRKKICKPNYLCIARILNFHGLYFCQDDKGCHILYAIIEHGRKQLKFHQQNQVEKLAKFSPGENFQLFKHVHCNCQSLHLKKKY